MANSGTQIYMVCRKILVDLKQDELYICVCATFIFFLFTFLSDKISNRVSINSY